jgi:hypothetical protein
MNPQAPPPVPKKAHGCFFYGCITSLILLLVVLLGSYIAVRMVIKKAEKMVAEYTDTAPAQLPKSELSAEQMKNLKARTDAFSKAVDAHSNTPPLVLTGSELNALLATSSNSKNTSNMIFVSLEGDAIKGQVSLPLDALDDAPMLKMFHLKGRYLNGACMMQAGVTNGTLGVYIKTLEVKGKPLPAQFLGALSQKNLADDYNKNPNNSAPFEKYESITVKDSTLIVTPKKE